MIYAWQKVIRIIMLVAVLVLAGCNAAPQPVVSTQNPTADLGLIRTQAAQTVVAQITAEALLHPSETPTVVPPTATTAPTNTAVPTLTPIPTATTATGGSGSLGGGGSVYVKATPTYYTDSAQLVSQNIPDGKTFPSGADFDVTWTFKNTGVREWNTKFYIKYLSGDLKPKQDIYMLPNTLAKGHTVAMTADFHAPLNPGRYTSNWALINDDAVAIFHMYVVIIIK
jgi:hypothetical protein